MWPVGTVSNAVYHSLLLCEWLLTRDEVFHGRDIHCRISSNDLRCDDWKLCLDDVVCSFYLRKHQTLWTFPSVPAAQLQCAWASAL